MTDRILNPVITERQEHLRELLKKLHREATPLDDPSDLLDLQHFVTPVDHEIREFPEVPAVLAPDGVTVLHPRQAPKAVRVNHYRLNDRGRRMYDRWMEGELDDA